MDLPDDGVKCLGDDSKLGSVGGRGRVILILPGAEYSLAVAPRACGLLPLHLRFSVHRG